MVKTFTMDGTQPIAASDAKKAAEEGKVSQREAIPRLIWLMIRNTSHNGDDDVRVNHDTLSDVDEFPITLGMHEIFGIVRLMNLEDHEYKVIEYPRKGTNVTAAMIISWRDES